MDTVRVLVTRVHELPSTYIPQSVGYVQIEVILSPSY